MTESSLAVNQETGQDQNPAQDQEGQDREGKRYPLSFTQEWFLTLDQGDDGGTFGPRFMMIYALRVTGQVDPDVLQGALDDVVARHELLRTVVIRDANPPCQQVLPPCQVPLEVRDLSSVTADDRAMSVQELILEAESGSISAREVPLIKALLCRFDDRDSALVLTVHHSACDAWSMQIILRDLGTCYTARRTGTPAQLPPMRQYREYAAWQRASATSTAEDGAPKYWQRKLGGAREFNIPNDHGHPQTYTQHYSQCAYVYEADVMAPAEALATATRSTLFTVTLAAFYVLAHQLTGDTDLTIRAFSTGRNEPEFQNTMGLFLNCIPFRTDITSCTSFRDLILATRETVFDAMAYELPVNVIEQAFPDLTTPREDLRTSQFIISDSPSVPGDELPITIADGAYSVPRQLSQGPGHHDIPSGMVWNLAQVPSGQNCGGVLYNLDEFNESTVDDWVARLRHILTTAVRNPDQDWRLQTAWRQ